MAERVVNVVGPGYDIYNTYAALRVKQDGLWCFA
jgi:hypothetical protein